MDKRKFIVMMILSMLMLIIGIFPFVMGAEPQFYFKVDSDSNINVPCFLNGSLCSVSSNCNISVNYPDSSQLVVNQPMSNVLTYHTYQLQAENMTKLGQYQVIVFCEDSGEYGKATFPIEVNNVGRKIDNFLGLVLFLVVLILFGGIMTGYALIKANPMVFPALLGTSYLFPLLFFFVYMNTIGLSRVFYVIYWVSLILSLALTFLVLWEVGVRLISRGSKKGKSKRDFNDGF